MNYLKIPRLVEYFSQQSIAGIYALGTTGEGLLLTHEERRRTAEAFVKAAQGKIPVIVQVGHESLTEARQLAAHAQTIGADAVSAVSPTYFKPDSVDTLVDSMAVVAAGAPKLPFYYYHIPSITGGECNMVDFLRLGSERIPTLRGVKFTSPRIDEYQACLDFAGERYDIFYGLDEMLLAGLTVGAKAAVGSTYGFAAPIYRRLWTAFVEGDVGEARRQQARAAALVKIFAPYGQRAAQKAIMALVGVDCRPCRLPVRTLSPAEMTALSNDLHTIGFFDWVNEKAPEGLRNTAVSRDGRRPSGERADVE